MLDISFDRQTHPETGYTHRGVCSISIDFLGYWLQLPSYRPLVENSLCFPAIKDSSQEQADRCAYPRANRPARGETDSRSKDQPHTCIGRPLLRFLLAIIFLFRHLLPSFKRRLHARLTFEATVRDERIYPRSFTPFYAVSP